MRRVGRFEWSIQLLAIFLSLVHRINLILHILTILNGVNNLVMIWLMMDHSKIRKMHFWMIQRAKKEVFGHFLDLGLLDQLNIACYDRTKWVPIVSNLNRSWRFIQKLERCIFRRSKVLKKGLLVIFSSLICWSYIYIYITHTHLLSSQSSSYFLKQDQTSNT